MASNAPNRQPFRQQPRPLTHTELWRRALDQLRNTLAPSTYDTWFAHTRAVEMRAGKLIIGVDNIYKRETLLSNHYPAISIAVKEAAGRLIEIEVIVDDRLPSEPPPDAIAANRKQTSEARAPVSRSYPALRPNYTLDSFIVGPSNQHAHAAATAVAENPGRSYNPLFIYSRSGLGKTHLLHAVAHVAVAQELQTICLPYMSLLREFVAAVQSGARAAFQAKFEQADMLLVDDIQGLTTEGMQNEFFDFFNDLHLADNQIVLASDVPPRRIPGLPERLITRFEWGMLTEMGQPEFETRLAILRRKCDEQGMRAGDDVLHLLAQRPSHSVRDLEQSLNQVRLHSAIEGAPISAPLALRALEHFSSEEDLRTPPTVGEIINATCEATGVPPEAFTTKRKDQRAARARHLAMYLAREHTGLSYKEIGSFFGDRDHTTVLHGYRKILEEVDGDERRGIQAKAETQRLISDIRSRLRL